MVSSVQFYNTSPVIGQKAVVHLHNRILLHHQKEGNLTLCDSMDGPGEYYAQWNKPVQEHHMISLICGTY